MKVLYGNQYFVGDPIHILSEYDMLSVRKTLSSSTEGVLHINGQTCWVCRIDANMEYADQNGNSFELPSGCIGLFHVDAVSDPEGEEHGVTIKVESDDLTCERELAGDTVVIGNLVISRV